MTDQPRDPNEAWQAPSFRGRWFWGVADFDKLNAGIDLLADAADMKHGWFAGDNLIAFGRNLGFLNDQAFLTAWRAHAQTGPESSAIWRYATTTWAARQAARLDGDFVECGCYKGVTVNILLDVIDLSTRRYFLYDLFPQDAATMPEHGPGLFEQVKARFAPYPNVTVIQGAVPDSFTQALPDKVAFAHIDMNNAPAEIGALEALAERFVPGAMIVLDDFGQIPYRAQHVAETKWFGERGRFVLELPTSQGVVIW